MQKVPFLISILCLITYKTISYHFNLPWLALLVFVLPITMLATNFIFRKKIAHKDWFSKPWNKHLETKTEKVTIDLSSELLFDKFLQDAEMSGYKLIDQNPNSLEILYSTSINFWTWGENIYIKIEHLDIDSSQVTFTSMVLFGGYSWKRNQSNFDDYFNAFENSLTI